MKITRKIYYSLVIMFAFVLSVMGLNLTYLPTEKVSAENDTYAGVKFSVSKINREIGSLDIFGNDPNDSDYYDCSSESSSANTIFDVRNGSAIMLNNADLRAVSSNYFVEAVWVNLEASEDNVIVFIQPSIMVNDVAINCAGDANSNKSDDERSTGVLPQVIRDVNSYRFNYFIDLTNMYDTAGNLISYNEGYITISIIYHYRSITGTTSFSQEINFGFYCLNEVNYINANTTPGDVAPRDSVDDTTKPANSFGIDTPQLNSEYALLSYYNNNTSISNRIEPRLYNTERIDRYAIRPNSNEETNKNYFVNYKPENGILVNNGYELNFFNYSNNETYNIERIAVAQTTDYRGRVTNTGADYNKVLFPTYTYDASKYNISYSYTYKTEGTFLYTSSFEVLSSGKGKLTFYKNGIQDNVYYITPENGAYIQNLEFSTIGEYTFTVRYNVREYNPNTTTLLNTYKPLDNVVEKIKGNDNVEVSVSKEYLIGGVKLSIYGFELYYTDDASVNASSLSLFKNEDFISDYSFVNEQRFLEELRDYNRLYNAPATLADRKAQYDNIYSIANKVNTLSAVNNTYGDVSNRIASTNQAPVEMKYLGTYEFEEEFTNNPYSYCIYYPYGKDNTNGIEITKITNSTRFTRNGTYDVVLFYSYYNYRYYNSSFEILGEDDAVKVVHLQLFTFRIANVPPTISIITESGRELLREDYTNESVTINVNSEESPFNVEPKITYGYIDFYDRSAGTKTINPVNGLVSLTGQYVVTVRYGQGLKSSNVTTFYIDKTPIENPDLKITKGVFNNNGIWQEVTTTFDSPLINSNFFVDYPEKISGAKISVTYTYIPFNQSPLSSYDGNFFPTDSIEIIKNGYEFNDSYTNTPYIKGDLLTKPGIYFFTLIDEAGNIAYKFAYNDNTAPFILQRTDGEQAENEYILSTTINNIVTENTHIVWGRYKAVMLGDNIKNQLEDMRDKLLSYNEDFAIAKDLNNFKNTFTVSANNNYVTLSDTTDIQDFAITPISNIKIRLSTQKTGEYIVNTKSTLNYIGQTFYANIPDGKLESQLTELEKAFVTNISTNTTGTKIYDISVLDSLTNQRDARLEMNLDHSLVLVYSYSDTAVKITENNLTYSYNYMRLYSREVSPYDSGTNRSLVYVTFKDGTDTDYAIKSLTYTYFPYALDDIDSPTYPFSSISANTDVDLLTTSSLHNKKNGLSDRNDMITEPLNVTASLTKAGLYIVRREYMKEVDASSGDQTTKYHSFIVDRNGIIQKLDDKTMGEYITLLLGKNTNGSVITTVAGLEFLVDLGSGNTIFSTNIVPIRYSLPTVAPVIPNTPVTPDKYYFKLSETADIQSFFETLNIGIQVYFNRNSTVFTNNNLVDIANVNKNGMLSEGNYKIVISDNCGYFISASSDNVSANTFEFIFNISYSKPKGNYTQLIESTVDDATVWVEKVISNDTTSVNSQTLSFFWTDPTNKFAAPINASKVTVTQYIYNKETGITTEAVIYNGNGLGDTYNSMLTVSPITVSGNQINKYAINLDRYAQVEGRYVVHLEYVGTYDNAIKGYFENNIVIYVDLTPPAYNVKQLISADGYLTPQEKRNLETSIAGKIRHTASDVNNSYLLDFENYVFAVNENTILNKMPDGFWLTNHDTYLMYIRQYDKYADEFSVTDGTYLQSLVKGDEYYNDRSYSTALFFSSELLDNYGNPYYQEIKYNTELSVYCKVSGYYEIIEIDEAGNHTIYSVYYQNTKDTPELFNISYIDNDNIKYVNNLNNKTINNEGITFDELDSKLKWYTVTLTDTINNVNRTIKRVYKNNEMLSDGESNSENQIINIINEFTTLTETMKNKGAQFIISISHAAGTYTVTYNTPGEIIEPTFNILYSDGENPTRIEIVVPKQEHDTIHTKIESIEIYMSSTNAEGTSITKIALPEASLYNMTEEALNCIEYEKTINAESGLEYISKTKFIPLYPSVEYSDGTHNGVLSIQIATNQNTSYQFIATDNFGRTISKTVNIDLIDICDIIFDESEGAIGTYQGITYTAGNTTFQYQSKLYSVTLYRNGELMTDIDLAGISYTASNGITTIKLIDLPDLNIKDREQVEIPYEIQIDSVFGDDQSTYKTLKFTYYNKVPTVTLYNSLDNILDITEDGTTSRDIYVRYESTNYHFPTIVTAQITSTVDDVTTVTTINNIKDGTILTADGNYIMTVANSLGAYYTYKFTKKENLDPFFTVYYDNTRTTPLLTSPLQYENFDYGNMDWYFSNNSRHECFIELNSDMNLRYDIIETEEENTLIYYIYTSSTTNSLYNKYIAVTYISYTNNILTGNLVATDLSVNPEDVEEVGTRNLTTEPLHAVSTTFVDSKVGITWSHLDTEGNPVSYYENPGNLIYCNYYYDGELAGTSYDGISGLVLIESGNYTFEFFDIAGNRHLFASGATQTYSYSALMLNEVIVSLNDVTAIDNIVFNDDVKLVIQEMNKYRISSITGLLNGVEFILSNTQTEFIFDTYGYYEITIKARVTDSNIRPLTATDATTNVVKVLRFSILNGNIARYAYEYSGHQIYKVDRNMVDRTSIVLNGLSIISSILMTPETVGNGIYNIYVNAVFDGLRPDQKFMFTVWINDEVPVITCNIDKGESTTGLIYISYNPYLIYSQIGESSIVLQRSKDVVRIPINQLTAIENAVVEYELEDYGSYIVQLKSDSNTIVSFVVTKDEPLNAIAIIVIVLASIALVSGTIIFIKLRTRMKIK